MYSSGLGDNGSSLLVIAELYALLDDIRSELMFREGQQLCSDDLNELGLIIWLAVLDDVLGDIVTVLICNKHGCTSMEFLKYAGLVFG